MKEVFGMRKLTTVLAMALAVMMVFSASALAYDGDIISLRASSDGTFTFDPATDPMAAYIQDKFGLTFEDTAYDGDFDKMRLDAMSGELADVCYTDLLYYVPQISEFIDQDFFREIPADMLEKYPLTKALLENDAVSKAMYEEYGGYYMLPKPDSADSTIYLGERKGIFIRKDWLEKLGLEMPETWQDLYDVAHAFTYDDPDGNGVNDTYGLTGDGMGNLRFFFASNGHSNRYWVKQDDGTWTHGALMKDNIPMLQTLRDMFNDGSIDPEFGSTKWEQSLQKFSSNTFGMVVRNADADWIHDVEVKYYQAANADCENPFDRVSVIPTLKLDENTDAHIEGYVSCMCATQFASTMTDEALDRFLSYFEYLLSDEGKMLRMGFEDIDWQKSDDGKIVKIRDANGVAEDLSKKYPSIPLVHYPSWGFEMAADLNLEYYDTFNNESKELNKWACDTRNPGAVFPDIPSMLISDTDVTDANSFAFSAEYWKIVSGTDPVEQMFDAMVDRAMQDGFETAITKVNEIATEKGW